MLYLLPLDTEAYIRSLAAELSGGLEDAGAGVEMLAVRMFVALTSVGRPIPQRLTGADQAVWRQLHGEGGHGPSAPHCLCPLPAGVCLGVRREPAHLAGRGRRRGGGQGAVLRRVRRAGI